MFCPSLPWKWKALCLEQARPCSYTRQGPSLWRMQGPLFILKMCSPLFIWSTQGHLPVSLQSLWKMRGLLSVSIKLRPLSRKKMRGFLFVWKMWGPQGIWETHGLLSIWTMRDPQYIWKMRGLLSIWKMWGPLGSDIWKSVNCSLPNTGTGMTVAKCPGKRICDEKYCFLFNTLKNSRRPWGSPGSPMSRKWWVNSHGSRQQNRSGNTKSGKIQLQL